ncbi:MAG: hypothetical protein ABFR82_16685 [Nitrospirota bacterium]
MTSHTKGWSRQALILKMLITTVLMLVLAAGCTSAPSETPEKFVLNFMQKHIPMIDISVADFYVKEEQNGIIERVKKLVASSKESSAATYDFSKIKVNVLDQKEEYVHDEAINFTKIAATGSYTKTVDGKSESVIEDEVIILESVAGEWKVTEKINPWK